MPDEIAMRREGNRLVPVDPMSAEMMEDIPSNVDVLVTVHQPRNLKQWGLAWQLATKVAESLDGLHDKRDAMDMLLIKARHVRYIHMGNGEVQIVPDSIRWAYLGQEKFSRIFNRMIYIVVTQVLPGIEESALRSEIEQMVGITPPAPKPRRRATRSQQEPAERRTRESDNFAGAGSTTGGGEAAKGGNPPSQGNLVDNPPAGDGNHLQAGLPTTPNEWSAYAKSWLNRALADKVPSTEITRRWSDEQTLRQKCGVSHKALGPVFDLYVRIVEAA